jgi:hypothetical protein
MRASADWVPAAVRAEAERIAEKNTESGRIARLLITDPRMKSVWKTLEKAALRTGWHELWYEVEPANAKEAAMVAVLRFCVAHGYCPNDIDTVPELRERQKDYGDQATRLREEASILRGRHHTATADDVEEQAKAIESVAEWCEYEAALAKEAELARDPESPVIKRDKGWRSAMGLADMIADTMKWIYGSPLLGTTANIVNVITKRTPGRNDSGIVTSQHVRDWLKTLRIKGT